MHRSSYKTDSNTHRARQYQRAKGQYYRAATITDAQTYHLATTILFTTALYTETGDKRHVEQHSWKRSMVGRWLPAAGADEGDDYEFQPE
jgi:hypothetical protein